MPKNEKEKDPAHEAILRLIDIVTDLLAKNNEGKVSIASPIDNAICQSHLLVNLAILQRINLQESEIKEVLEAIKKIRSDKILKIKNDTMRQELTQAIYDFLKSFRS